jgi:MSHA pilin protein MshC
MKLKNQKTDTFSQGFTLIEIVAVLVVISILVAVAASRVGTITDTADNTSAASTLRSHLRYAQIRALNTQGVWGVNCSGSSYSLYRWDGAAAITTAFPGEENNTVAFPNGISINSTISFDDWGRPHNNQAATGNSVSVNLSVGGETITVTQETGYIP